MYRLCGLRLVVYMIYVGGVHCVHEQGHYVMYFLLCYEGGVGGELSSSLSVIRLSFMNEPLLEGVREGGV